MDFDVYHAHSELTDKELEEYTDKLRDALTANNTYCCVTLEDSVISIFGDKGGDNTLAEKILFEMCEYDCWLEKDIGYRKYVISIESALGILTCGQCKNCVPEDSCGCDCLCTAKNIEVSQDDEIHFYGEHFDEACERFESLE